MATAQTQTPPSTHPPSTAPFILTKIRTNINSNIPSSIDRNSAEYLHSAARGFKSAIDELDVWILQKQSKVVGIETQLPTVVHEYDGERRDRLEERLQGLKTEREDLRTVRMLLVGDHEDVGRRLREAELKQV